MERAALKPQMERAAPQPQMESAALKRRFVAADPAPLPCPPGHIWREQLQLHLAIDSTGKVQRNKKTPRDYTKLVANRLAAENNIV